MDYEIVVPEPPMFCVPPDGSIRRRGVYWPSLLGLDVPLQYGWLRGSCLRGPRFKLNLSDARASSVIPSWNKLGNSKQAVLLSSKSNYRSYVIAWCCWRDNGGRSSSGKPSLCVMAAQTSYRLPASPGHPRSYGPRG
jgi:hypothetical protein